MAGRSRSRAPRLCREGEAFAALASDERETRCTGAGEWSLAVSLGTGGGGGWLSALGPPTGADVEGTLGECRGQGTGGGVGVADTGTGRGVGGAGNVADTSGSGSSGGRGIGGACPIGIKGADAGTALVGEGAAGGTAPGCTGAEGPPAAFAGDKPTGALGNALWPGTIIGADVTPAPLPSCTFSWRMTGRGFLELPDRLIARHRPIAADRAARYGARPRCHILTHSPPV